MLMATHPLFEGNVVRLVRYDGTDGKASCAGAAAL